MLCFFVNLKNQEFVSQVAFESNFPLNDVILNFDTELQTGNSYTSLYLCWEACTFILRKIYSERGQS